MPYKQGVTGSNPVGPTSSRKPVRTRTGFLFPEEMQIYLSFGGKQKSKAFKPRVFYLRQGSPKRVCNPVGPTSSTIPMKLYIGIFVFQNVFSVRINLSKS